MPPEGFLEVKNWFADLKKDWRRPAAVLLRLAILFWTFGPDRRDAFPLLTDVHQRNALDNHHAESPEPPDGLGGR